MKYSTNVSTALLYCGLPQGFVIGADGRAFNELTQRVDSDKERKIFAFENSVASVVFAWSGTVNAFVLGGSHFSLVERTYELLPELNFNGLFAPEFNAKLKNNVRMLGTNQIGKAATGIFLSYRKGHPWVSQITVYKNGRTWDCGEVEEGDPNGEIDIVSGPDKSFENPRSLDEAENMIATYLDDCVSHPTEQIGGHVHIARFTPEGFSWARSPK